MCKCLGIQNKIPSTTEGRRKGERGREGRREEEREQKDKILTVPKPFLIDGHLPS
jgi:hypothetical protein